MLLLAVVAAWAHTYSQTVFYYSFAIGTGTATTTWNARNTGEIQIIGVSYRQITHG
jgi:hypothetical protein